MLACRRSCRTTRRDHSRRRRSTKGRYRIERTVSASTGRCRRRAHCHRSRQRRCRHCRRYRRCPRCPRRSRRWIHPRRTHRLDRRSRRPHRPRPNLRRRCRLAQPCTGSRSGTPRTADSRRRGRRTRPGTRRNRQRCRRGRRLAIPRRHRYRLPVRRFRIRRRLRRRPIHPTARQSCCIRSRRPRQQESRAPGCSATETGTEIAPS